MHNAPAVSYPLRRSMFHGLFIVVIVSLGATTLTIWTAQADALQVRHLGVALLWLISTCLAAWYWFHTPVGALTWDGVVWTSRSGVQVDVVVPKVLLDVSGGLLLRLQTQHGGVRWVWPERRVVPLRWLSFRRAVFGKVAATDALNATPTLAQDAPTQVQP